MHKDEIDRRVREIIADTLGRGAEEIPPRAALIDDLGLDSLALIQVAVDVDYEFRLGLPEEELHRLRRVDEVVALVLDHRAAAPGKKGEAEKEQRPVLPAQPALAV